MKRFLLSLLGCLFAPATMAFADWTPLITSADFTGPMADVSTIVLGMIKIFILIFAGGLVVRHLRS